MSIHNLWTWPYLGKGLCSYNCAGHWEVISWVRRGPLSNDKCPCERAKGEKTYRGGRHGKTGRNWTACDCRPRTASSDLKLGERQKQILRRACAFTSDFWSPELWENTRLLFQVTQLVVLRDGSPRNLRQTLFKVSVAVLAVLKFRQSRRKQKWIYFSWTIIHADVNSSWNCKWIRKPAQVMGQLRLYAKHHARRSVSTAAPLPLGCWARPAMHGF